MTTNTEAKIQALETRILELEGRELPSDEQVQRLKDRIWRVAMTYKKSNRWCDEYDRLLKAAGVAPNMGSVVVETMVPATLNVEVNMDMFGRLTPEEQTAYLTENITFQGGGLRTDLKVRPVPNEPRNIQVLSVGVAPESPVSTVPDGYRLAWTSDEGRVAHYVRDPQRYSYSLCSKTASRWRLNAPGRAQRNDDGSWRVCARCASTQA